MLRVRYKPFNKLGDALKFSLIACLSYLFSAMTANAGYVKGSPISINFSTLTDSSTTTQIDQVFDSALTGLTENVTYNGTTYKNQQIVVQVGGAIASRDYNADGHVVGPVTGTGAHKTASSYTLDNLSGPFLQNNSEGLNNQPTSQSVTISFGVNINNKFVSVPVDLTQISFDYEIFPDINCTALNAPTYSDCGGKTNGLPTDLPSLVVKDTYLNGSGNSQVATDFQRYAVTPGQPGQPTTIASCPQNPDTDCGGVNSTTVSTTQYSPASTPSTPETAPQLLGTSGLVALTVGKGVTQLTFNDWPATIAFNQLTWHIPEPNSVALLVVGLLAMGFLFRRSSFSRRS